MVQLSPGGWKAVFEDLIRDDKPGGNEKGLWVLLPRGL
jgi:hypothetical protein